MMEALFPKLTDIAPSAQSLTRFSSQRSPFSEHKIYNTRMSDVIELSVHLSVDANN